MKKTSIIAIASGFIAAGVGISFLLFMPKEKIELSISDNKITWNDNSNTSGLDSKYHIYNDDFLVNKVTENGYFLTKEKLIDEDGPTKVDKIKMKYTLDNVKFQWDDIVDVGTDNNIWVSKYTDKGRQEAYSNIVKMNFASGLYKYIVTFDGVDYEIWDNEFEIDRENLKEGISTAKLYGIDNRGNKGVVANIPLYNYNIILSKENETVRYHIDDNTQSYTFKASIDGKDIGIIENENDINDLLIDKIGPKEVIDIDVDISDKNMFAIWGEVEDIGTNYNIKVDGYGNTHYNVATSDEISVNKKSELKGYMYAVNKNSDYNITDKDVFIDRGNVSFTGEYGTYYLHVASQDNEGNLSATKTYKFVLKDPFEVENDDNLSDGDDDTPTVKPDTGLGSESDKKKRIESMFNSVGAVSATSYSKAVTTLMRLPNSVINEFYSRSMKIHLTSGEAEDVYHNITGNTTSDITGAFVWNKDGLNIIVESSYLDSSLMHEIGHAIDYVYGKGGFVSNGNDFNKIFELEKNNLFLNNQYISSSAEEYFAESFSLYYNSNSSLRAYAPETFAFIGRFLSKL